MFNTLKTAVLIGCAPCYHFHSLIITNQNLKRIKSALHRADNKLLCEDLEPILLGSCVGRSETMKDHILGLESKISSLFSLRWPPWRPQKDTVYFIWLHIIKLLLMANILVRFVLLLRIFKGLKDLH